ncbi:MAG: type I secretion system permease/ATPase [Rickettsiales bacterium]|nr:type I secretion system permease/ATPase [Rickettsiales bacterium]
MAAAHNPPLEDHLKPYMLRARRTFMFAWLFSFCSSLFMLALPLYSLQVLDRVISSHSLETLFMLTLIIGVGIVFYGMFSALRTSLLNQIGHWLDYALAPKLLEDAITKSSLGAYVNAAQHQRDLGSIKAFITNVLGTLMDVPWSLVFLLVIYLISPALGFLTVIGMVILIAFGAINELATKDIMQKASEEMLKSNQLADTASRNADAVETMGMMQNIIAHWQRYQKPAGQHAELGASRANMVQSMAKVVRLFLQIAVTGIGAYLAMQNELTVGGMIASSILVGRALAPFENAIGLWKGFIAGRESYHRLNTALATATLLERGTLELPTPEGHISVENIIYTPPRGAPIIKGVTFHIRAGESLGIIGPSAAGKSTLSKLIMGLLPPTHGAARLDGAETFKWNRHNFGKYVGYMPQQVDLFSGTIKDNIARMDIDAPMEPVVEAAQMAGVHEMILRLPNGYETQVDMMRASLSPGQRQRIGLARALYGRPKFVLLDEPNTNLDGDGERALVSALTRMKQAGITHIVVAHRPTIVSMVDKILVLKAGTVERFGPRDEVLRMYTPAGVPQVQPQAATAEPQASLPHATEGGAI